MVYIFFGKELKYKGIYLVSLTQVILQVVIKM